MTTAAADSTSNHRKKDLASIVTRRWPAFFTSTLIAGALLGLTIAAMIASVLPKQYLGQVHLEISLARAVEHEFSRRPPIDTASPRRLARTQSQFIQSEETLNPVIDELQLEERWKMSGPDVFARLKEKLKLKAVWESFELQFYSTDPHEAAEIANAVARAFQTRRANLYTAQCMHSLNLLNAQETLQEQKVENARQRMIALMEKFGIADPERIPSRAQIGNDRQSSRIEETSENAARVDLRESGLDDREKRKRQFQCVEAKRAYETQTIILADMQPGMAKEAIELSTPFDPVVIARPATEPETPAPLSLPQILVIGFSGLIGGATILGIPIAFGARRAAQARLRRADCSGD